MTNIETEKFFESISYLIAIMKKPQKQQPIEEKSSERKPVEMLTIKECLNEVKGLSDNTLRILLKQNKIPCIRAGEGVRGKILINKIDLYNFFNQSSTYKQEQ